MANFDQGKQMQFNQAFFNPEAIQDRLEKKLAAKSAADVNTAVNTAKGLAPIQTELYKNTDLKKTAMQVTGEKDVAGIRNVPAANQLAWEKDPTAFNRQQSLMTQQQEAPLIQAKAHSTYYNEYATDSAFNRDKWKAENPSMVGADGSLKPRPSLDEVEAAEKKKKAALAAPTVGKPVPPGMQSILDRSNWDDSPEASALFQPSNYNNLGKGISTLGGPSTFPKPGGY